MHKKKKIFYFIALIPIMAILFLFGWFFTHIFEGEVPQIVIHPLPEFLSGSQKFTLNVSDMKRGLRTLKVSVSQERRQVTVFEKKFDFKGLFNQQGAHRFEKEIFIDPLALSLSQGRVDFTVRVWDYSRRGGGDGNMAMFRHKMTVDTIPPAIRAISRMHNINKGGACLVIYQTSSDTEKSGLFVDDLFFPGFPVKDKTKKGIHICYFAIPYDSNLNPSVFLWARDRAGNRSKTTLYHRIRRKRFRRDKINITDGFLKRILPYFSSYHLEDKDSDIKKFLKINNELRKENHLTLKKIGEKSSRNRLWEGPWLRMKNSATMARFGDHRNYFYKGKKIDSKTHLGVDLASLTNSPVQASNNGKVVFKGRLGIYGLTVVLDHGQGLASLYGHLSKIDVEPDQDVKKGDIIGLSGQTGLAGGDHLHFGIMVNGIPTNPIEWWDGHWIKDNITKKLEIIN